MEFERTQLHLTDFMREYENLTVRLYEMTTERNKFYDRCFELASDITDLEEYLMYIKGVSKKTIKKIRNRKFRAKGWQISESKGV